MKKHPIWFLIIGIFILIVPTFIYLCFLIPMLSEEYNVLMASGGIIGIGGIAGTELISNNIKFSNLYKLSIKSLSIFSVLTIVQEFIGLVLGAAFTFVVSYIIFKILMEVYKNARRRKENEFIAREISRNIAEISK